MAKVRMADIADKVGVSTVTVHNALSGQKGVSEELRQKIQQTAKEMGYIQNTAAVKREKNKEKRREMRSIGAIIAERYLADYTTFYWKVYQEMAISATDKNCMAGVEILRRESEDKMLLPRIVQEGNVDGLIIIGEISKEYIRFLRRNTDMPVVFLDFYDKELARDAVIADNFYGMYLMTGYLLDKGIKTLAYVGSIHSTSSIMDRYCGFSKALMEQRIDLPKEWLIEDRDENKIIDFQLPEKMPEAFVCNCDLTAAILIMKLEKMGYRVPEDISVVGFDNFLYYPGFPDIKITSYEVNTRAMAKVALEKVLKQLKNPDSGRGLAVVSGHIVEKETVRQA